MQPRRGDAWIGYLHVVAFRADYMIDYLCLYPPVEYSEYSLMDADCLLLAPIRSAPLCYGACCP